MHEMALTEGILNVALEEAKKHGALRIKSLTLQIGALRQVIPETLRFCFEVMSRNTLAEGAELIIEEIPLRARCPHCEREVEITDFFICPECGLGNLTLLQGDELILAHMELEVSS